MSKLRFIALSGTTGVTENLYVYEYGNEMIIVDCGVGFPDLEMRGVDLVIPDFTYIKNNKSKLKGIVVSQGHEDHQGALPFLLRDISTTIYAPKLVSEFIKDKLNEHRIKNYKMSVYNPDRDTIDLGVFKVTPFRVAHSIPDTLGFVIDTPEGRVFHVAEHKFDPDPVDGNKFDIEKAKKLAEKEILFLASDCLGSNRPGTTKTEKHIEENMHKIMKNAKYSIFFTTISSNIGRIQQVINIAQKMNRKVAFVGRSISEKSKIANKVGYLKYDQGRVIHLNKAVKLQRDRVIFIIAGCYGQMGSSLFRVATNEHNRVVAQKGDMVVFSADPAPPYTKESEDFVIDNFIEMGTDVHYYDMPEGLYVSGHGSQDDIVRLFDIVKPKYFIPIGGTVRFMHSYRKLAENFGAEPENIFELKPGDSVEFQGGKATRGKSISVKQVLVDGYGIGDVGKVILKDRKTLGQHGAVIVVIKLDVKNQRFLSDPEIISRGFVFEKEEKEFLRTSARKLRTRLERQGRLDASTVKYTSVDFLAEYFYRETARRPMIIPVVVEV